jgi:integrase
MEARRLKAEGKDPLQAKRDSRAALAAAEAKKLTFRQVAEQHMAAHRSTRPAENDRQWRQTLAQFAYPKLGELPVAAIEVEPVRAALAPIWETKTETATRLRSRIEAVLDAAKVRGLRTGDNPARWKGNLDKLLPEPGKIAKVVNHAALPYRDVPTLMTKLEAFGDHPPAVGLRFLILTATRTAETRLATWGEVDLAAKLWMIPGDRMKVGKPFVVPLSDAAIELLGHGPGTGLVFDFGHKAMLRLLETTWPDVTVHGMRSSFRDWAAECTRYPREVIELSLAHVVAGKTEKSYWRSDLLEKRRALMDDWAAHCTSAANGEDR